MDARHVRRARARRRALGLAAVGTAAGVLGVASTGLAGDVVKDADQPVTICHATGPKIQSQGSTSNPYVMMTKKKKQIISQNTGVPKGHGTHEKDVIPAFTLERKSPPAPVGAPWVFPGMNLGSAQMLEQDCFPLTIKKTGTATVGPGGTIDYQVTVTNLGLKGIALSAINVFDPDTTLKRPDTPTVLGAGKSAIWTGSRTISSSTEVCGTTVTNTAYLYLGKVGQYDPAARENQLSIILPEVKQHTSSWTTNVVCPPVTPEGTVTPAGAPVALRPAGAGLSVTKTGPARMLAGGRVSYRVTVTNTGSADATGVVLRDQSPGALTLATRPAGATVSGRNINWNIGTLTAGQSVSATVRFAARRTASGRVCNVAIASATGLDAVRDTACTTIVAARRPATPVTG